MIDLSQMPSEALDMPFGLSSGAGAIFGVTGGVTEAVLRRLVDSSAAEDRSLSGCLPFSESPAYFLPME